MDTIRKHFRLYYIMLYCAGLWPYDHSIRAKVQRIFFSLFLVNSIVNQVSSLKYVEFSLKNVVLMLSYTLLMMVYFLRYVGFISNFALLKSFLEDIENDFNVLENETEMEILRAQFRESNRVNIAVFALAISVHSLYIGLYLAPTLLQLKSQLRYLHYIGYFYDQPSRLCDLSTLQVVISGMLGILGIASTEATFGIYGFYLSALFRITSYRLRTAIEASAMMDPPLKVDISSAVMMHQRACRRADAVGTEMMLSGLTAIIVSLGSYATSLFRGFLSVTEPSGWDEMLLSFVFVVGHTLIFFIDNVSGQALMDNSEAVFYETYNTRWYRIPIESQKMVQFILAKSMTVIQFNFAGLFIPSYEGFASMMSTSFSYFTVLYSV